MRRTPVPGSQAAQAKRCLAVLTALSLASLRFGYGQDRAATVLGTESTRIATASASHGGGWQRAGQDAGPSLEDVVARMSRYVEAYGEQASMFVGTEKYSQRVSSDDGRTYPTRNLVAEFAIVKAGRGETWIGYRDVVEVNRKPVVERRDRLLALLSASSADASQLTQIANESARYNIGPISRNFNVPTTALFFFHPTSVARFSFKRKGTKDIDGVATWALAFTEARRPTLVMTRAGRDVPCEGTVWVEPNSGTIVRTLLLLRNFSDTTGMQTVIDTAIPPPAAPSPPPPPPPAASGAGGTTGAAGSPPQPPPPPPPPPPPTPASSRSVRLETVRLESLAQIEVTYRQDPRLGVWLPFKMSELYEGAVPGAKPGVSSLGRAANVAEYSGFKRFETSAKIVAVK